MPAAKCERCNTSASYGVPGTKMPRWCKAHKADGAENVVNKLCEHCSKQATFGMPGTKTKLWCKTHKAEGAVDVVNKLCERCEKHASYGVPGGPAKWCKAHGPAGAENVISKRCETCKRKQAIFGLPGTKTRRWCGDHRPEGAVDVNNKICKHPECDVRASCGAPGSKTPLWCAAHKPEGSKNVVTRRCEECGDALASYGMPGTKTARWCSEHKPDGAEDVKNMKCEHCGTHASFGMRGTKRARWCVSHKPEEAENVVNKKCAFDGCDVQVSLRYKYSFCAAHDTERKRNTRVRENQVANYLRDQGLHWTAWNKQVAETACGRYRPDFVYELDSHVVVVEVDEQQHAKPGYACDAARMLDIFGAYGGTPVVFLRFNPDGFKIGGVTKRTTLPTRLRQLETQLRAALEQPPPRQLTIVRLFYDDPQGTVAASWVSPDDPSFIENSID